MKPTTRTLLPLAGAALAYSLAQTMVIPALPELQAEFHANPADATWLLTAFLLTSSVATPCSAAWATCTARSAGC